MATILSYANQVSFLFRDKNICSWLALVRQVRELWSHCYRAWLLSDHRSELALPIVFSATATEHGCSLIPTVIRQS